MQRVACVFQSHVLYVPLVLCRVLYLPPFSAAVGPAAFCPWAAQSRQTREIQRNTNPVPPWKTRSQWSNLESQLLLKLFCTHPLIHSQAPFRQGGVKDLSGFFWNIPSGPTHPQHLLSICLNPSLVSFWASCSYCIQQPAVKIPRERSSCGASGNWKKAVPSYKISSAISSITGGRSFVLFALLSSHVCEHIV